MVPGTETIELLYWLRFAILGGLVGFCAYRAWRSWLRGRPDDMARRILLPWVIVLGGFSIYLGLLTIIITPLALFWVAAIVMLWVAVPTMVSILVVDLAAKALRARRTGLWLGAGIAAFLGVTFGWLTLLGVSQLLFVPGLWLEFLAFGATPVAAAFTWWSFLPGGGGEEIAEAFE